MSFLGSNLEFHVQYDVASCVSQIFDVPLHVVTSSALLYTRTLFSPYFIFTFVFSHFAAKFTTLCAYERREIPVGTLDSTLVRLIKSTHVFGSTSIA